MLTAAVCGEVFASPSVEAVLAGILAVTGEAGCLLIVKNYTGDRRNFGLAAERARAVGRKVEMVVVDDDIALPDLPQPRGGAGTLFVHKIAGALAEDGASLDDVAKAARSVIGKVVSIGMSLDTCTIPGSSKEDRIGPGKAELGLGIHGEPGVDQVDFSGASGAMNTVVEKLKGHAQEGDNIAIINNLGSTTPLEMSVLTHSLTESGIIKSVIGPAPLMTSLNMHGFSVSIMNATRAEYDALAASVPMSAWPGLAEVAAPLVVGLPDGLTPIEPIPSKNAKTREVIAKVADLQISAEGQLTQLDGRFFGRDPCDIFYCGW